MRKKICKAVFVSIFASLLFYLSFGKEYFTEKKTDISMDLNCETEMEDSEMESSETISDSINGQGMMDDNPADIELQYIPELGYMYNIEGRGLSVTGDVGYACWKDWLIIGDEAYKKQENGIYKRMKEHYVYEMLDFEMISGSVKQYNNFIIAINRYREEWCFSVFDLDTWEQTEFDCQGDLLRRPDNYWHVYEGKIYYESKDRKSIQTIDLSSKEYKEFYRLDEKEYQSYVIEGFSIREDGAVFAVFCGEELGLDSIQDDRRDFIGDNLPYHIEYWCIQSEEDGMKESKIGETDEYAGLGIQAAKDGLLLSCVYPITYKLSMERSFYLKENGEMIQISVEMGLDEVYWVEDGYYCIDSTKNPKTEYNYFGYQKDINAVSKYDFEGKKLKTYCLIESSKLYWGWYILDLIIYNGQATAFFANDSKDYLYISQIPIEFNTEELETEMPADEIDQIKKLQEEGIENSPEELPVWEGRYTFHEICPPAYPDGLYVGMDYDIEIYSDGRGGYCADIRIEGYQTCYLFRANVYGDSEEIHLYFKESLFEDREWGWPIKTVNLDEEIMSFVRDENGGGIYTTLGQLEGSELLIVNIEAGGIYLDKVE